MMEEKDRKYNKGLIEALLFLSEEPVKLGTLAENCGLEKQDARDLLDELILDYVERDGGYILKEIAGSYQFISNEIYFEKLSQVFKEKKRETLTRGTIETLAIIAYKQPITQAEIDEVRGVSSRAMVTTLLSKKLIKAIGQKEVPGRPTLFGTTNDFLIHFNLNKLSDLPAPTDIKELRFDNIDDMAGEFSG